MSNLNYRYKKDARNIDPYEARTIEDIERYGWPNIPIQEVQLKVNSHDQVCREAGLYD